MGVASLVLGIISIILALFSAGILGWVAGILGIIGIILGALGRKNEKGRGIATAGLVCSIIGTILGLLLYVACAMCVADVSNSMRYLM